MPKVEKVLNSGGGLIGYLEKYADTATESHPWKAFGLDYSPPPVGRMRTAPGRGKLLGFYDEKSDAIKKVENNTF